MHKEAVQQRVRLESKKTSIENLLQDNLVRRRDQLMQVRILLTSHQILFMSLMTSYFCCIYQSLRKFSLKKHLVKKMFFLVAGNTASLLKILTSECIWSIKAQVLKALRGSYSRCYYGWGRVWNLRALH